MSRVPGPARCRCAVCREGEVSHLPVQPLHSEALEDGPTWTSLHWGTYTAYSEARGVGKGRGAENKTEREKYKVREREEKRSTEKQEKGKSKRGRREREYKRAI